MQNISVVALSFEACLLLSLALWRSHHQQRCTTSSVCAGGADGEAAGARLRKKENLLVAFLKATKAHDCRWVQQTTQILGTRTRHTLDVTLSPWKLVNVS